jgi:hypothetical protein
MPADRLIFAGVSGSPGSVHALRYAADLARHHDAILVPLLTWVPPCGDLDERKHPSLQLRELWKDDAWQRLWAALDTAFGGFPSGVRTLAAGAAWQARPGPGQRRPPGWRPAGHRNRAKGPIRAADRLPGEPLLPASRPVPGPGHPASRAGPASRPRPSRLGVPPPRTGPRQRRPAHRHELANDASGAGASARRRQAGALPGPRQMEPISWRPDDRLVGIEILDASTRLHPDFLEEAEILS